MAAVTREELVVAIKSETGDIVERIEQIREEIDRAEEEKGLEVFEERVGAAEEDLRRVGGQIEKLEKHKSGNWEALGLGITNALEQISETVNDIMADVLRERSGELDTTD
jgi:predicted  nucleic acid-binding Zn-ribbon protein